MKRERYQNGSVQLDYRTNTWYFRWRENGQRKAARLGTLVEIPTKAKATRIAEGYRISANTQDTKMPSAVTFEGAARLYMTSDRFPQRFTTNRGYRNYLERYAIPKFGELLLTAVRPLMVDKWFKQLPVAPKTKAHIKTVIRQVFEHAMLAELFTMQRNPMDLVRIVGASGRDKDPRILTLEEWQRFLQYIAREPMRTMVVTAFCLGIRRSELAGLKWSDFDWQKRTVLIQRGVIANRVDVVKTKKSKARLPLDPALIELLQGWHSISEFQKDQDWVWASPLLPARCPTCSMPYSVTTSRLLVSWLGWGPSDGIVFGTRIRHGWVTAELRWRSRKTCCGMPTSGRRLTSMAGRYWKACEQRTAR